MEAEPDESREAEADASAFSALGNQVYWFGGSIGLIQSSVVQDIAYRHDIVYSVE